MSWTRSPAFAGKFYPKAESDLLATLDAFFPRSASPVNLESRAVLLAPHAGYRYSGRIAAAVYRRIRVPDRVILLCPSHRGIRRRISVWDRGSWVTPLGEVPVDEELAARLLERSEMAESDPLAHSSEHAIEVHLPFLQRLNPGVRIVPIVLGGLRLVDCLRLGEMLATTIRETGEATLLIASSDMSHHVSAEEAKRKDQLALARWEMVDAQGLYRVVGQEEISMCGFVPATSALAAANALGASAGEILKYGHSGEVTGNDSSVVAYAAAWV